MGYSQGMSDILAVLVFALGGDAALSHACFAAVLASGRAGLA